MIGNLDAFHENASKEQNAKNDSSRDNTDPSSTNLVHQTERMIETYIDQYDKLLRQYSQLEDRLRIMEEE